MALNDLLTPKQSEVLHTYLTVPHSMIILNGAVRAGKTRINNFIFLYELKRVAKQAKEGGDRHPIYILAGASSGSIYNNVVAELSRQFGIDLKPDRHNHYHLFGVDIVPVYTKSIAGLTDAGIWTDDNSRVIPVMMFQAGCLSGSKKYRLELTIFALREALMMDLLN